MAKGDIGKPRSSTLPHPLICPRSAKRSSFISRPYSEERRNERWIATECSPPSTTFTAIPTSFACWPRGCCTTRSILSAQLSRMSGNVSPRTSATRRHGWPSPRFSAKPHGLWRRVLCGRSAETFARRWVPLWEGMPRAPHVYRRRFGGWNGLGLSTPGEEGGRSRIRGLAGGSRLARRGRGDGPSNCHVHITEWEVKMTIDEDLRNHFAEASLHSSAHQPPAKGSMKS